MVDQWIWTTLPDLFMVLVSGLIVYIAVILMTRLSGLRSFAKFSAFDFAITIAIGSLISAALLSEDPPLLNALAGIVVVFSLQRLTAILRRYDPISRIIDNQPTVLMKNGELQPKALRSTSVTEDDLRSILRQHNICNLASIRAVILETTGDVSVLHTEDDDDPIDPWLLEGIDEPG